MVMNGIVENFHELRAALTADGHVFRSQTDAEAIVHLVESHYNGDLVSAVRSACTHIDGHYAFVVAHRGHPHCLVASRQECPLVVGLGTGETFIASMASAFVADAQRVQYPEDGDVVAISAEGAQFFSPSGEEVERPVFSVGFDDPAATRQGNESYTLKEIHEQPASIARTLAGRTDDPLRVLAELGLDPSEAARIERVAVVACGTAYHAGLVGRYAIEEWARIPCDVDIASEWRHRNPLLSPTTLVVGISQSGETADTLAALRLARRRGARTVAITNMAGSQITREVDGILHTQAGLEMGVAATKTFTAQACVMYLLAIALSHGRGTLTDQDAAAITGQLESIPAKLRAFLSSGHPTLEVAARHYEKPFFLYLGRHVGLPVCLEGALKLKEVSYIPTEAYSAGEMKHGPIALLQEGTPVVCVATDSHVYGKIVSNIEEVRARGAHVIAIATDGNESIQHLADDVIYVPPTHPYLQPLVAVVPLQLLAYEIACFRGQNVDRPRNLAKTVTVE